ncbi:MAG: hypothetical protein LBB38_02240 [Puniceicoccales bacterium]|jgi:hypothetical protein|nr:hypothetical protein [Puniceicoccales bacterium]
MLSPLANSADSVKSIRAYFPDGGKKIDPSKTTEDRFNPDAAKVYKYNGSLLTADQFRDIEAHLKLNEFPDGHLIMAGVPDILSTHAWFANFGQGAKIAITPIAGLDAREVDPFICATKIAGFLNLLVERPLTQDERADFGGVLADCASVILHGLGDDGLGLFGSRRVPQADPQKDGAGVVEFSSKDRGRNRLAHIGYIAAVIANRFTDKLHELRLTSGKALLKEKFPGVAFEVKLYRDCADEARRIAADPKSPRVMQIFAPVKDDSKTDSYSTQWLVFYWDGDKFRPNPCIKRRTKVEFANLLMAMKKRVPPNAVAV